MMQTLRRFIGSDSGSFAVPFAVLTAPILFVSGLAIDYSQNVRVREAARNALDAAVLTGSAASNGPDAATAVYLAGMGANAGTDDSVRFWTDSSTGVFWGKATVTSQTSLMKLAGATGSRIDLQAGAKAGGSSQPVCMLTVAPTGTALTLNSSATIDAPNCEIHVRSRDSAAVMLNSSAVVNAKRLCDSGGIVLNGSARRDSYKTGCSAMADPFAGKLPAPVAYAACSTTKVINSNTTISLDPGLYCNLNVNSNVTLTFKPGFYVISGALNLGSNVNATAKGVIFYLKDSGSYIQLNSNAQLDMTPPSAGTYAGISMYEPALTTRSNIVLNANASQQVEGLFYLPSRNVTLNSQASISSHKMALVAYTLMVNSSAVISIDKPDEPTTVMTATGDVGAVLVQ
ncbi:TadE/TadG family type IV pilus assembly protein [Alsobacter sp. KACC 23698]|uniref:TadE/TadG family type IV pilus assembly protein n=1 Tax=Alsobacter sp. KACC 23698 TaxID=3149229 RepID=A0AAU7JJI2_9HYPH